MSIFKRPERKKEKTISILAMIRIAEFSSSIDELIELNNRNRLVVKIRMAKMLARPKIMNLICQRIAPGEARSVLSRFAKIRTVAIKNRIWNRNPDQPRGSTHCEDVSHIGFPLKRDF